MLHSLILYILYYISSGGVIVPLTYRNKLHIEEEKDLTRGDKKRKV